MEVINPFPRKSYKVYTLGPDRLPSFIIVIIEHYIGVKKSKVSILDGNGPFKQGY